MSLPIPFPSAGQIQTKTSEGYQRRLWIPGAFDYDVTEDNFKGDALKDQYPAAKTNGTSAAVTFTEHNANGYLELVTGTSDNGYAGQGFGLHWLGDTGILAEFIIQTPSDVSTLKFEVGLSDADDDAGAVNAKATPTFTATDCAVFVFDTDDDANLAFLSKGASEVATQDISKITIAASTKYYFAIRVQDNTVQAWAAQDGSQPVHVAGGTHVVEGGNALTPWVFCQARAGAASRTLRWYKWRVTAPAL